MQASDCGPKNLVAGGKGTISRLEGRLFSEASHVIRRLGALVHLPQVLQSSREAPEPGGEFRGRAGLGRRRDPQG